MLTWVVSATLAFGLADDDQAKNDAAKELTEISAKIVAIESYRFTSMSETEGGGFGARGGGGGRGGDQGGARGGERPAPRPTQGAWQKGLPMELTLGDIVAYKDGDQLVYKNDEGEWAVFEMPGVEVSWVTSTATATVGR